jgi:hypothetical protein
MPRKKLIRHFEPRYGVSQPMLEIEGKYVQREHEDYLLLSTHDLRKRLETLRSQWRDADEAAERMLYGVNERESLAWQCLITRDYYLMLELYGTCLRHIPAPPRNPDTAPDPPEKEKKPVEKPKEKMLPFSEWLFDPNS